MFLHNIKIDITRQDILVIHQTTANNILLKSENNNTFSPLLWHIISQVLNETPHSNVFDSLDKISLFHVFKTELTVDRN